MPTGEFRVEIQFSHTTGLGDDDDAEEKIHQIRGKIVARGVDANCDFDVPIGLLDMVYVDVAAALETGNSLHEFFDLDAVTCEFCSQLYDLDTGGFLPSVRRALGVEPTQWNTLILDRLKILPNHRGKKLGLSATRKAIEQYRFGCGVVVTKPFPLQLEEKTEGRERERLEYQLDSFEQNAANATERLTSYYLALGLQKLPDTDLLVFSPDLPLPSLEDLGCAEDGYYEVEY